MAVAALVLLAIVLSANGAGYGECVIYGHRNVSHFGALHGKYTADAGWIWLVNSSTVEVQGEMEEVDGHIGLTGVTIGGSALEGGVVHLALHECTWYPPNASKQVILQEEDSKWSTGILEASVIDLRTGNSKRGVIVKAGDFELEVSEWSEAVTDRLMSMKLVIPLNSSDTGLCVNGVPPTVSDKDNLAVNAASAAMKAALNASSVASVASDKSGTADTLLYLAWSLGFLNSVVPFVL
jgi:hypothetical protein